MKGLLKSSKTDKEKIMHLRLNELKDIITSNNVIEQELIECADDESIYRLIFSMNEKYFSVYYNISFNKGIMEETFECTEVKPIEVKKVDWIPV